MNTDGSTWGESVTPMLSKTLMTTGGSTSGRSLTKIDSVTLMTTSGRGGAERANRLKWVVRTVTVLAAAILAETQGSGDGGLTVVQSATVT